MSLFLFLKKTTENNFKTPPLLTLKKSLIPLFNWKISKQMEKKTPSYCEHFIDSDIWCEAVSFSYDHLQCFQGNIYLYYYRREWEVSSSTLINQSCAKQNRTLWRNDLHCDSFQWRMVNRHVFMNLCVISCLKPSNTRFALLFLCKTNVSTKSIHPFIHLIN